MYVRVCMYDLAHVGACVCVRACMCVCVCVCVSYLGVESAVMDN